MNRIGPWIASTFYPSIRNCLKSKFQLHTSSNSPNVGGPIKSFLNQIGFKREACWVDVRVARVPTKTYVDVKPPKNCSFGVFCYRPPPKITRIMAKEKPRKTLPIETKSTNVHLSMQKKKRFVGRSRACTHEE